MKFVADLDYLSGYLRAGQLVGNLTDEEYKEWLTLDSKQQQELLWDVGSVVITDYNIEDIGECCNIKWEDNEIL